MDGDRPQQEAAPRSSTTTITAEDTRPVDYTLACVLAIRGCTCEPDITIEGPAGGVQHANVAHDDWCPVLAGDAA